MQPHLRQGGLAVYVALFLVLLVGGAMLVRRGLARSNRSSVGAGLALIFLVPAIIAAFELWGEMLWFQSLGFVRRFWTAIFAAVGTSAAAALVSAALVAAVTWPARLSSPRVRRAGVVIAALSGATWGVLTWETVLPWLFRVDSGVADPILGRDASFYLFSLPFYDAAFGLLLWDAILGAAVTAWSLVGNVAVVRELRDVELDERARADRARVVHPAAGVFAAVLAFGAVLRVFHVLYSRAGVVNGPGWTDVHVRMPAYAIIAAILALGSIFLLVPRLAAAVDQRIARRTNSSLRRTALVASSPMVVAAGAGVLGLFVLPVLLQWLVVTPNELALERPYLENDIAFTRRAFGLDKVESRQFEMKGKLSEELVERSEPVLSEVRLWDPTALDQVLEQFQEFRLYYELTNVDIDRYTIDDRYRQVMVAPREMETRNLPRESQTFVNRHFKYTHGYGFAMAPVSEFTPDGLPQLVVRDIPPVVTDPSLAVTRPEIYFGERTDDFVVVNSRATEFDYPSGAENVYVHYEGKGGVELSGLWRRLVYGWKLGGTRLLFSDYPTDESRVMFRRNVHDRVSKVAPFLRLDEDPYAVLVDGRIHWIVDGYTTSSYYPYSESVSAITDSTRPLAETTRDAEAASRTVRRMPSVNYMRNSVKAVVDAYDGSVHLYAFDPEDPVLRVWSRVYPGLVQPLSVMPEDLRAHVRYPEGFLHVQGVVYSKYHMTDPEVFYNQEDLWVNATEKHFGGIRDVDPYYVMWQPPDARDAEFIIMQPYTPKHRQVLIGWLAGMCDRENYGRLLAYRFPKDRLVIGPQQVETKIDQDPQLSAQLTLWDQRGKRVIRGNVLAIPLVDTILYVEPIYIQAQAAAYPELRVVVVMHGDDMTHAATFREALDLLLAPEATRERAARTAAPADTTTAEALDRAQRAFESYARLMGESRFAEAAAELEKLREALGSQRAADLPTR